MHFTYPFIDCVLGAISVSGLILGAGDTKVNKLQMISCPHRAPSLVGKIHKARVDRDKHSIGSAVIGEAQGAVRAQSRAANSAWKGQGWLSEERDL